MIWKIAWGSVVRHGRRSLLIILVVAISVAVMLFVTGMLDGMRHDFFQSMVSTGGHVQVDHPGVADALDPYSLELLIENWQVARDWFVAQPETVRAEPILTFGAMVLMDGSSVPMVGRGVEPETGYFTDVREGITEGRFLSADNSRDDPLPEILLSTETADMLELSVGDTVSVLVEDSTGAPYYLAYTVVGLFRSNSPEFDQSAFLITHREAQELLYLEDQTRQVRVVLQDENQAETVAARFAAEHSGNAPGAGDTIGGGLSTAGDGTAAGNTADPDEQMGSAQPGSSTLSSEGLRVRTWQEINGGLAILLEMFDVMMYAVNLLILIVAATVITNAILMNVFEKIQEFGMMRAIGLTRKGQFGLVLAEGSSYGVIGSLLGVAIGVPVVMWFSTHGIYFGEMMDSFGLAREVTTRFDLGRTVVNTLFGAAVAVTGSLYAGLVAVRMSVIDSMRGSA
jgi:putative ABC transport system permease protein